MTMWIWKWVEYSRTAWWKQHFQLRIWWWKVFKYWALSDKLVKPLGPFWKLNLKLLKWVTRHHCIHTRKSPKMHFLDLNNIVNNKQAQVHNKLQKIWGRQKNFCRPSDRQIKATYRLPELKTKFPKMRRKTYYLDFMITYFYCHTSKCSPSSHSESEPLPSPLASPMSRLNLYSWSQPM